MAAVLRFLSELFSPRPFYACQWQDPKPKKSFHMLLFPIRLPDGNGRLISYSLWWK